VTDTTISISGKTFNVIVYQCAEHGDWRAEAGYRGRVVEVIDTPDEAQAWTGIRKALARRTLRGE